MFSICSAAMPWPFGGPSGGVRFEIDYAQVAAVRLKEGIDLVRDFAAVKSVAALLAEERQRARQIRVFENVAFCRDLAAGSKSIGEPAGVVAQQLDADLPVMRDELAHGKSLAAVTNRRREKLRHGQLAEFRVQLEPAVDRARHRDRQHAPLRNRFRAKLRQLGLKLLVA
jgi:hypothetical protein